LKATLLAALLTLLLAPGGPVFAQALPSLPYALPEGEAPPTLFSAQIGDSEVDFVLEGSWRTELAAALGLVITPEGLVYAEEFPGFGSLWPPVFRNFPRLTFTIWLRQRFFLESSVVWDFVENPSYDYTWWDKNYWLAGYRGLEGEFLRSVLVGNREVAVDPYPFLEVPETGSSSLGASALLGAGRSSHQLMLRYDNNEPAEAIFLGKNRVEKSNLDLDGFIRGRFFRLPDAGVEDLEVYLENLDARHRSFGTISWPADAQPHWTANGNAEENSRGSSGYNAGWHRSVGSWSGLTLPETGSGNPGCRKTTSMEFLDNYGRDMDERQVILA
jgi:hypothetical protein